MLANGTFTVADQLISAVQIVNQFINLFKCKAKNKAKRPPSLGVS